MKWIVGLGNPERRYQSTPHNIGFEVLDAFASRHGLHWSDSKKVDAVFCEGSVCGVSTMLIKPTTYMNNSGKAIAPLMRSVRDRIPCDLMVVYDDIDLPIGRLRFRPEGSAGTHNGMRSLIRELGMQEFARLRCGILPAEGKKSVPDLANYVLAKWSGSQKGTVQDTIERAGDALEFWLDKQDMTAAMNRFNVKE